MKIEKYAFGRMTVSGNTFTSDVVIFPERIRSPWWREEGHLLQLKDIEDILKYRPEALVIGTGYYGQMRVDPEVIEKLRDLNIDYYIEDSRKGMDIYNSLDTERKVGAFHLTC